MDEAQHSVVPAWQMTRTRRQRPETARETPIREAADQLPAGRSEDSGIHVQRVDTHSKPSTTTRWDRMLQGLIAAVVGLICVSAIGLASYLRVPESKFILSVEAEAVALKLNEPWTWSDDLTLNPDRLRLEELAVLEMPAPGSAFKRLEGSAWAQIEGGQATLSRLDLAEGGILRVEISDNGVVDVYARGAEFSGELTVLGAPKVSAGTRTAYMEFEQQLELRFPETIAFRTEGQSVVPARLRIRPKEDFVLYDLRVQSLSFSRDVPGQPGATVFVSTILGGTVLLSDVSESVELQKRQPLSLEGVTGRGAVNLTKAGRS